MDIQKLRGEIDGIDKQMLELFQRRMHMAAGIAEYKRENNLPVRAPAREREILSRVGDAAEPEMETYARTMFSSMLDLSRAYQASLLTGETELSRRIRQALENTPKLFPTRGVVACQGVEGAYSQLACDRLFPAASIMYFKHFENVFQAVERGLCQFGILPIENSAYGSVNRVYDLMRGYHFHIVRSLKLQINHALLVRPGTKLADVREIYSHEQALGQCSAFLENHRDIRVHVCENTALAAKAVAESGRADVAAISSAQCAELYGLTALDARVQNTDHNYTRFICISKELLIFPGASKISLMLSVSHKPGALYEMISRFAALGLNLAKLESRPVPGRDFEFLFYFDIEASVYSEDVVRLLSELSAGPETFVFLGSYGEV